jgi:hypothetical protein
MKRPKLFNGAKVNRNTGLWFVEYWKRIPNVNDGWELDHMRSGGSEKWAELCAADILKGKTVVTTRDNYHRDTARADFCTIGKLNGRGNRGNWRNSRNIDPECVIVPSVGELGWSP